MGCNQIMEVNIFLAILIMFCFVFKLGNRQLSL